MRLLLLFGLLLGCFARSLPAQEIQPEKVTRSIETAVKWLKKQQKPDGSWQDWHTFESGVTSLATLALLEAGVAPDDPVIQKALNSLRQAPRDYTYCVALQTMALCAAGFKTDIGLIQKNVDWLEGAQQSDGAWGYGSGDQPARRSGSTDNSNSQYALLALYAAEEFSPNIEVNDRVWRMAYKYWRDAQNVDGSWGYKPQSRATGSMTCAGISSLHIATTKVAEIDALKQGELCCQTPEDSDKLERGLRWMGQNFRVSRNPGGGGAWYYYYMYGLERAGRLTAQRFFESPNGAKIDWYRQGVFELTHKNRQVLNGVFLGNGAESNKEISTSLALLFLAKGRRPLLMAKVKHGPGDDWNNHREDVAHLTKHVSDEWGNPLSWQTIDLRAAKVEELAQIPILFISGRDAPTFNDQDAIKLRLYIEQGGFIFAEACCQNNAGMRMEFKNFIEQKVFNGEYRLSPLPATHPIWRTEAVVPEEFINKEVLHGINFSCRTSVVFCEEDLSCKWQFNSPRQVRKLRQSGNWGQQFLDEMDVANKVGLNVCSYATNRELKYKYELFDNEGTGGRRENFSRGHLYIASLLHSGNADAARGALPNLQKALAKVTKLRIGFKEKLLSPSDDDVFQYPLLFMHGRNAFTFREQDRENLKLYCARGGVLLADSICASKQFDRSFRKEMQAIFPEAQLEPIPADHPIYGRDYGGYDISSVKRREPSNVDGEGAIQSVVRNVRPTLEGIKIGERYAVIYSPYDISCALEDHATLECRGYLHEDALRIGVNMVLYALNQPGP